MKMRRWIRKIVPFLAFLNIRQRYQRGSNVMKIEAAKAYVLGIKKSRSFLLGALFVSFSWVLLFSGLLLIHVAFFAYSDWSVRSKYLMALWLGGFEILIAGGIMFYLFREETWIKFSGIDHVVNSVLKKKTETASTSIHSPKGGR